MTALLADLGGTNVRFALADPNRKPRDALILRNDDFPGLAEAAEAYLSQIPIGERPTLGAFAVASPVLSDRIAITNRPAWSFSILELRRRLGLTRLEVVNDFTAAAMSVPRLHPADLVRIGGGVAAAGAPIAIIGPGTGLGVSGLIALEGRWIALAAEGGHATMAAFDDCEAEILAVLRRQFGHISAERVISGMGIENLYGAMREIGGQLPEALPAEEITARATAGACRFCTAAVETFSAMLGTVASNLALTLGARGGVYIAGGIVPKLGDLFVRSAFRSRFEDKGRFSDYLAAIPTWVIQAEVPAFLGLAALLEDEGPGIAAWE